MNKNKSPKNKINPSSKKIPRTKEDPINYESKEIAWHINTIDRLGNWGWNKLNKDVFWNDIFEKIKSFESMTWSEIKKNKKNNHSVKVSKICPEAQNRLGEIELDDVEELFSLRLGSKKRIWGIRNGRVLKILWWDPNHTVYCSFKKNT